MQRKSIQGFTLIEMLIVIAVISILAGIVLVGITGFQSSARDTRRIGDLRSVQNSLELFFTRCGHYPINGGGCGGAESLMDWGDLADSMVQVGIISSAEKLPIDPKSSNDEYEYGHGDGGFGYVLRATLENPSSALEERGAELDGTVYGIDCEDNNYYYCIGSS